MTNFIYRNIFNINITLGSDYVKSLANFRKYLLSISKPEYNILDIYDDLASYDKYRIFNTLFDVNEIQVEVEREDEQDVEVELETELAIIYEINEADYFFMNNLFSYYYIDGTIKNNYYKWLEIVCNHDVHLIFSINLFTILPNVCMIYCLIRIAENMYNCGFYQSTYSIYTLDGNLINLNSVPPINRFATSFASLTKIDLTNIFNVNVSFSNYSGFINLLNLVSP